MTGVISPWKPPLKAALHRNRSDRSARFFQLATVDPQNHPQNRTVVFRGFWQTTDIIQIVTDSRSEKLVDIQHCPKAAICWYFTKTREQFRLNGRIETVDETVHESAEAPALIKPQTIRNSLWRSLSDTAKLQWYWPQPKGDRTLKTKFVEALPDGAEEPPENFVTLLFFPQVIDHLQLRGDPQTRHIYELSADQWRERAINP